MSLTTANVSSIEKKSSNPFKGVENVIDLPLDEKLKLQLEVKEIKKHLEELKDATVT
jgi:transcriptional regulator